MASLVKRGSRYICIISVPLDLQASVGCRQIWKALPASTYKTAKPYARHLLSYADHLFLGVRFGMLDPTLVKAMIAEYALNCLTVEDKLRLGIIALPDPHGTVLSTNKGREIMAKVLPELQRAFRDNTLDGKADQIPRLRDSVELLCRVYGVVLDDQSGEYLEVMHEFGNTEKILAIIEEERYRGDRESDLQHRMITKWEADVKQKPDRGIPISQLFVDYVTEWSNTHRDDPFRVKKKKEVMAYCSSQLLEYFRKDMGIKEFKKKQAREWRDWLQQENDLENSTVNKRIEHICGAFNWELKRDDCTPRCSENSFKSIYFPRGRVRERNRIFTNDELQQYMNYLAKFHRPCFPEKTWIPVIMAFSGMRNNEVAQLYLDDLREEDGIKFFMVCDYRDSENPERLQRTKTGESRQVPIHQTLLDFGLLEYADSIRQSGHVQLFPNCQYVASTCSYYSGELSMGLNGIVDLVSDDTRLRVYSLRSQFRTCAETNFAKEVFAAGRSGVGSFFDLGIRDIMGHQIEGDIDSTVYRKNQLLIMSEIMAKVEYPVDLSPMIEVLR